MRKSNHHAIRNALRLFPDGTDAKHIAALIGRSSPTVFQALRNMPDAYIDRWNVSKKGQYSAIWCLAEVPENCPHPVRKSRTQEHSANDETQKQACNG